MWCIVDMSQIGAEKSSSPPILSDRKIRLRKEQSLVLIEVATFIPDLVQVYLIALNYPKCIVHVGHLWERNVFFAEGFLFSALEFSKFMMQSIWSQFNFIGNYNRKCASVLSRFIVRRKSGGANSFQHPFFWPPQWRVPIQIHTHTYTRVPLSHMHLYVWILMA